MATWQFDFHGVSYAALRHLSNGNSAMSAMSDGCATAKSTARWRAAATAMLQTRRCSRSGISARISLKHETT